MQSDDSVFYQKIIRNTISNIALNIAIITQKEYNNARVMIVFLNPNILADFSFSHYRRFQPGEKHVTRRCSEDVLILMISGILRFTENGIPHEIGPGEYYIQQHGLQQQGISESDLPYYYYIHFHGGWSTENGIQVHGEYPASLLHQIQQLEELNLVNASLLQRASVFYQILCQLPLFQPETTRSQLAETIRSRLSASLQTGITLGALAAELHFTPNYLIRIFRDAYGKTPMEYLSMLRLEKAEQLIRYSGMPLSTIATECGFGSYVNLYKAFRKHRGFSPGKLK